MLRHSARAVTTRYCNGVAIMQKVVDDDGDESVDVYEMCQGGLVLVLFLACQHQVMNMTWILLPTDACSTPLDRNVEKVLKPTQMMERLSRYLFRRRRRQTRATSS
jgi:hypothetical protein